MLNFNALSSAEYENLRFSLILQMEGSGSVRLAPFLDQIDGNNIPTMGAGFNLQVNFVLTAVLRQLGLSRLSADDAPFIQSIENIVTNPPSTSAQLQADLDAVMANRAAALGGGRTSFTFQNDQEVKTVFDEIAVDFEDRINIFSPEIPQSFERTALFSLAFNSVTGTTDLLGDGLRNAIAAGDRAEAFYEIRYNSNKNDNGGIAKRRLIESHLFGLFEHPDPVSSETFVPDETQALQVFRMFTRHEKDILSDDTLVDGQLETANGDLAAIKARSGMDFGTLRNRGETFQPAFDLLTARYLSFEETELKGTAVGHEALTGLRTELLAAVDAAIIGREDISSPEDLPLAKTLLGLKDNLGGIFVVTPTSAGGAEVAAHMVDRSGDVENVLVFGDNEDPDIADTLKGGAGDDFFVASKGIDNVDGDAGIDTLAFVNATAAVSLDLGTGQGSGGTVQNVENIIGSVFDDILAGDANDNILMGLDGADLLSGGAGNDILIGGAGADTLIGGDGDDVLVGGEGADVLDGGAGTDSVSLREPFATSIPLMEMKDSTL